MHGWVELFQISQLQIIYELIPCLIVAYCNEPIINLAEVQLYNQGKQIIFSENGITITMSSSHPEGPATNCMDNNLGSFCSTSDIINLNPNPWLTVSPIAGVEFDTIQVINRVDSFGTEERISGARISLTSNNSGTSVLWSSHFPPVNETRLYYIWYSPTSAPSTSPSVEPTSSPTSQPTINCPKNSIPEGSNCICNDGYYGQNGNLFPPCVPCPPNSNNRKGSPYCTCNAGYYSTNTNGTAPCLKCPDGYVTTIVDDTGHFLPIIGQQKTYYNVSSFCVPCFGNHCPGFKLQSLTVCSAGQYKNKKGLCTNCPPGFTSNGGEETSCTLCFGQPPCISTWSKLVQLFKAYNQDKDDLSGH